LFSVIAALPPVTTLALEARAAARSRAIHSSMTAALPPPSFWAEVHNIVLAWALFFGALAFVYAAKRTPSVSETSEPEDVGDQATAGPELEARPISEVRAVEEPSSGDGDSLPAVPNLPEAQASYKKGIELYGLGRCDEAIVRFDKALKLNPRLASAWAGKGLARTARREYQEAIRCYDESLRLDPRNPAVWHDKANTLCAIGRLESGLNCFNEALIIDPRDASAWNNKSICLASLGRHEEAISCSDKAIAVDPSYAVAWHAKAMIEERLGRIREAVVTYKSFIALAPVGDAAAVEKVRRHVSALEAGPQEGPKPAA
jgi:tetratricopeptide (TPR) repeat protein